MKQFRICTAILFFAALPLLAQSGKVVLPHFAADEANFKTQITVENRSKHQRIFPLRYLSDSGGFLTLQNITLAPGQRQIFDIQKFENAKASHAIFEGGADLFAGITYTPSGNPDNPIFIPAISEFSKRWRTYPSNWNESFDGLVIVNPGCFPTLVRVQLFNEMGEKVEEFQRGAPLEDAGKWVFNLGDVFQYQRGAYLEISADQPIAVMSLKGNKDFQREDSILVGNLATPYSPYEDMRVELRANRDKWSTSGFGGSYQFEMQRLCFCLPEFTQPVQIKVRDFQFESLNYVTSGEALDVGQVEQYLTVESLFDYIDTSFDKNVADVSVTYHPTFGYPTSVVVDFDGCLADEEVRYVINELGTRD